MNVGELVGAAVEAETLGLRVAAWTVVRLPLDVETAAVKSGSKLAPRTLARLPLSCGTGRDARRDARGRLALVEGRVAVGQQLAVGQLLDHRGLVGRNDRLDEAQRGVARLGIRGDVDAGLDLDAPPAR